LDRLAGGHLRGEVANARVWGGFHYRGATSAGLKLGEQVARWDLGTPSGRSRTTERPPQELNRTTKPA
jgi:hypothetical protein